MKTITLIALYIMSFTTWSGAQTITQTVKGQVINEGLYGVNVILLGSDPIVGTSTGVDGSFILENVPVGRQSFEFSMVGYESYFVTEILVTSGKEVIIDVPLREDVISLDEIVVVYQAEKDQPINEMAAVSGKQFTVEETQRYAGGLNDPARLVSSFAGVASPGVSSNGISVRGNSPSGLLWRVEGVEVPSPNHFADLTIAGAGALTVLSSQMMTNSDFYTGAFPAEYGNATSGVFDINLRSGNSSQREHTFQAGILGIDFATEGPFKKGKEATYLLNYRYSTLALVGSFLPDDAGILKYQDLSYKINMPTKKAGTFSLWSIGAYDAIDTEALDQDEWESKIDRENSQTSMYMFASGLNHKITLSPKTSLNSTLAYSGNGLSFEEQYLDDNLLERPQSGVSNNNYKLTLQSTLSTNFGSTHFNQTGFYINQLGYDLDIDDAETVISTPENVVNAKGQSHLFQFYTQSQFNLASRVKLNAGLHSQYFQLNEDVTLEPRVSIQYQVTPKSDVALAYGLHSKVEPLSFYFIKDEFGNEPNKNLKLMKSNHVVLSFNSMLGDNLKMSIEPYYQHLYNVPVSPDSYISTLNIANSLFFDEVLVSTGTGKNIGIDFTLERYLKNGFYYLGTASFFDSKYTANDGIERNSRLNKNYVLNAIAGKEWQVGRSKNNTLSVNLRVNYLGGNRIEAIDLVSSTNDQDIVYGEAGTEISFAKKHKKTPISSYTVTYRKNKPKHSSVWSLQVLNSGLTEEFDKDVFNLNTQSVEREYAGIMIPNLSYKIEF